MLKAVFFDLDGTLLPMDQDAFVEGYFKLLARKMAPYGYEPEALRACGEQARAHIPVFESFYANEFQQAKALCGFTPSAAETVRLVKALGLRAILATNPLFPAVATESRVRWAGLEPEDFAYITTYENSTTCKPNPAYYRELLDRCGLRAQDCLMVGNDTAEDMIAETIGIRVFLLTDCLINRDGGDLTRWRHGGFAELADELRRAAAE